MAVLGFELICIVGVAIKMGATKADFDSCVAIRKSYFSF